MSPETLLYRLVHPAHVHGERFTSQVFRPPADSRLLTVFDETAISPEEVWAWSKDFFPSGRRFVGIVAVSVVECESLQLSVAESPGQLKGESAIDFVGLSRSQLRQTAAILRSFAADRGWIFRVESPS